MCPLFERSFAHAGVKMRINWCTIRQVAVISSFGHDMLRSLINLQTPHWVKGGLPRPDRLLPSRPGPFYPLGPGRAGRLRRAEPPLTHNPSLVNYSSQHTESSSEHYDIDLNLLKANALWCENKRCSDSNPWPMDTKVSVLPTTPKCPRIDKSWCKETKEERIDQRERFWVLSETDDCSRFVL